MKSMESFEALSGHGVRAVYGGNTVLLGNVALRTQLREKLTKVRLAWDSAKLEFTNLPEANQFLRRAYREGWSL